MLLLAGAQILCGNVNDAVGVDVEGYLDLWDASRSRSDAVQTEHTQGLVVLCHFTLALQDMDLNRGLVVGSGGENLGFLGRDGGVSFDNLGRNAAQCFQTQRQRGNVQQQQTLYLACQYAALDSRADCYALIRVDSLEWVFAGRFS